MLARTCVQYRRRTEELTRRQWLILADVEQHRRDNLDRVERKRRHEAVDREMMRALHRGQRRDKRSHTGWS
jgi:hypothetical protein